MLRISLVVILSTALAGIITGTKILTIVDSLINKTSSRSNLFLVTTLVALFSATFGCTQAIAIIMTQQLMNDKYEHQLDNYQLAIDIENTALVS